MLSKLGITEEPRQGQASEASTRSKISPDREETIAEESLEQPPRISATSDSPGIEKQQPPQHETWIYETLNPVHEIVFVALICCAQFLTQAAFGQLLISVQAVGRGLGATNPGQLSWTLAGYSLTVGTFVLPAGRLGDMYGSKLMVIIGWIWFGIFSIIGGLSVFAPKGQHAVVMLATCQGLKGIGPAILLPNALAICGRVYPNGMRKNMVFALFAMCAPTGATVGALFAGIFTQLAWWPWMFWSLGITAFCMAIAVVVLIPADRKEDRPKGQKFDFIGAGLGVSGLILFNFAWNQAAVVGWQDPYVPTLLGVGIVVLVVFVLYENRVEQPLLPTDIFSTGSVTILAIVALGWASFGVWAYYTVRFIIVIRGHTPLGTVAQLSTLSVSGISASIFTGLLVNKIPPPWLMVIAGVAFTTGNLLVATMPSKQVYWAQTFVSFIIIPFGMDISFPAAALILSDMVPRHLQGVAASLVNTVVNYSISIGIGVAGTAEREVHLKGESVAHGYHVALWISVGMAGGALVTAVCFALYSQFVPGHKTKIGGEKKQAVNEADADIPG